MTMHKERNITFPELLQRIALYSRKSPMKAGERFDWRLRNDRNRRYESRDHIQGGRYGSHHLYFGYDGVAQGSDALVSKYIGQCPCSLWRSTYLHAWASHTHPIAPTSCATPGGNCRDGYGSPTSSTASYSVSPSSASPLERCISDWQSWPFHLLGKN